MFASTLRTRTLLAGALILFALGLINARAAAAAVTAETSANWGGYAVTGSTPATPAKFTRVFAAWVQPTATCVPGQATYSAFWVGLGGFNPGSQALEQVGTDTDCTVAGQASYSVWYELVPAAPVTIKLAIRPGDSMVASVAVLGKSVTVKIINYTLKKSFTKKLTMKSPDVSSAEWIAEAPSTCTRSGMCVPLPLANFGTVTFVSASATAAGHTGSISDPAWTATAIELGPSGGVGQNPLGGAPQTAGATPGALSPTGSSFGVDWIG
ncbi:MAG: hypothetical protein QOD43_1800 [Gaiellaceae bacterium]|nr:hypothetical protein [Gaiellaceae bacterium]